MNILRSITKRIRCIAAIVVLLALVASNASGVAAAATGTQVADCTFATLRADLQAGGDYYYAVGQCPNPIVFTSAITISSNASLTAQGHDITLDGGNSVRLFKVNSGVGFGLAGLILSHGSATSDNYNDGGAIYNEGALTITESTFSGNTASGYGGGGAIANESTGTLAITRSTFSGNTTAYHGGAIEQIGSAMTVTASTFSGNTSGYSGGAINVVGGSLTVTTSTFFGNSSIYGGAIDTDVTTSISNSTFAENSASRWGGSIAVDRNKLSIGGTIIASKTSDDCYRIEGVAIIDKGYNLEKGSNCGLNGTGSVQNTDPKLDPNGLQNNGGPTQTIALQRGSPAIEAGSCTDTSGNSVATDQRGVARPADGDSNGTAACDVGAYEAPAGTSPTPPTFSIPGLIGYWQLEEGSGTFAYDVSGSGKHARLTTPSAWTSEHAPTEFNNSFAYHSQVQDGYTLNAPLVTTQVDNLTLAAWIKWDGGTGAHRFIVMNGNSASSGYGLIQYNTNGHIELIVAGKAFYDFGYTPPIGSWVHLALVRSSGTWRLYVNGVPQGGTTTTAPATPAGGFYIGSNGTNENFSGLIDDVRFYNRALSASEIVELRGGCFSIQSQQTGYVLDMQNSSTAPGAQVVIWPQTTPASQRQLWTITADGYIKNRQTGYVLDVYGGNTAEGTAVIVWPQNSPTTKNQLWTIMSDGHIKSQLTGYVLDVYGAGTMLGTAVIVWPQKSPAAKNQLWTLVPAPSCS